MRRSDKHRPGTIGGYWLSQRGNSPVWCRTWYDSDKRQTCRASLGTTDLEEAELRLAEWVTRHQQLHFLFPMEVPLDTILIRYFEKQAKDSASAVQVRIALRYWSDFFDRASVSDLSADRIEAFIGWLRSKEYSSAYINRTLAAGRAALNRAYRRQEVQWVPHVPRLKEAEPRHRYIPISDVAKLFDACTEEHLLIFLMLAFNTLSRPIALFELTHRQVDKDNRLIHLNAAGRAQSKKVRPTIPITRALLPFVSQPAEAETLIHRFGRPIKTVRSSFRKTVRRAGLGSDVTPYAIRHTMATELRRRGVSEWDVAGMLGHRSPSFRTTEVYAK